MTGLIADGASVEKLWTGGAWLEGPAWVPSLRLLLFSDIPNDRILAFDPATGETAVHRTEAEFSNGRTVDLDGSVLQASHGRRAVERESGARLETVVSRWAGGRFNSPNDLVVASDGAIWFTDPPYGLHKSGREGHPGEQEYDGCFVFRWDGTDAVPMVTDMVHPNGLAFSPDESLLYIADTGFVWNPDEPRQIRVYDTDTWEGRLFVVPDGVADGFRVDREGRLWTSSSDAIQVFDPDATLLLRLPMPEKVSNLCFGGQSGHDLYVTASTSLYRVRTTTSAAPRPGR